MKILIIRTIQVPLALKLIKEIGEKFGGAEISVLTNPQQFDRVKELSELKQVFCTRSRRDYSFMTIGLMNILKIRKSDFHSVIIPHMQAGIGGFGNVLVILPLLKIRNWFHCSTDWKLIEIKKSTLWTLFLKTLLSAVFFIPMAALTLVGFLYVLIADRKIRDLSKTKRWYAGYGDL